MKTLINSLLIAGASILIASQVQANNTHDPENKVTEKGPVLRQDKVSADMTTIADRKADAVYDRKVMLSNDGIYEVVVTDAEGNVRMEGSYINEELTQPNGEFTYYYPNGNVESKGMYANGVKTGTWYRYNEDGSPKAERNYTGMTWEDMAVTLGMASKAGSN